MAWLYVGTFGSFIGYSAAFPLLLKTQFPEVTSNLAFLGALVGSVARPLGGKLADRIGGARVTLWNFVLMALATIGVIHFVHIHSFAGFLAMFLALFVTTGVGNGSTFRMIPVIFRRQHLQAAAGQGPRGRRRRPRRHGAPRERGGDRLHPRRSAMRRLPHLSALVRRVHQGDRQPRASAHGVSWSSTRRASR